MTASAVARASVGAGAGAARIEVKICGIRDAVAYDAAAAAGADWVGLNFFPGSPRVLTPSAAAALPDTTRDGGPARIGLFVDPTDADIAVTVATVRLDALQLYAAPARLADITRRFAIPVWQVLGVQQRTDLVCPAVASRMLVEPKPAPGASRPGGNAQILDWGITAGWRASRPWMLAGGLTPDNVVAAIRTSGAPGVDVSSGVETAPGVKSAALIDAFVRAAKAAPTIRAATIGEAEAVACCQVAAWQETYPGLLPASVIETKTVAGMAPLWAGAIERGEAVFVARDAAGIVGFAAAGPQRHQATGLEAEVRALYVLRRGHRQGLGRALMGAMAGNLLDRGLHGCSLLVLEANTQARQFYEAMGGRVLGVRQEDGVAHVVYGWNDVSRWQHAPPERCSVAGCAA